MAEVDIRSPLLVVQPVDPPQLILTIREDSAERPVQGSVSRFRNPFDFLGSEGFDVPDATTVDPFHNDTFRIEGVYEWFKILFCLPLALARLVLFGFCLLLGYLATRLALEGWKDKENPMPKWRCRIMWITRLCARCILFSFGYHWIRRKGRPAPRETAPIVVSNHVSFIEPIFYFYELFPTMVAAESHDSIPFVGTIIRAMQVIYVNRFSQSSRKRAVNEIKLNLLEFTGVVLVYSSKFSNLFKLHELIYWRKASCDRFPRVLLFPEGTTTSGRVLISFQLGAFIPGYPIQPVVVRYPHVHFDQSWGHISLAKLMFRMFTQFHNYMEVEYLPVVSPLDHKNESAFQFAKRTSHDMATALNVVQTLHTYGDLMLLMKASQENQEKPSKFMVEMARMELLSCISSIEAVEFLDQFLCMNPDSSGRVNYEGFLRVLHLKACPSSEQIFAFIDVEKSGTLTFKQFLFSSVHVLSQPLFRVACELAFAELNLRGEDYISELELEESMKLVISDPNSYEVHEVFELFDSDGNGEISKEDFCGCLRRNPLLIALFLPCFIRKNRSENGGDRLIEEIV